ncbi:MAG: DUF1499 domain-containing protein [Methylomarinum sp.]|nr:DUF1499 domain-containing protein [Methylomarinum sp.]
MTYKPNISAAFICIFFLSFNPSQASEYTSGLIEGKLRKCPDSPNCVSSEALMIAPIKLPDTEPELAWSLLQQVINEQGGEIQEKSADYLLATFTSAIFGFSDDVEARIDLKSKVIHLRSASRVGYYDFGTNRRRLQEIIKIMQLKLYQYREENTHK